MAKILVKAVPRAARDELAGWLDDHLKVRIAAQPENGKANAAIERVIATALGLHRSAVRVVTGRGSARKCVEIDGLTSVEILRRLAAALDAGPARE